VTVVNLPEVLAGLARAGVEIEAATPGALAQGAEIVRAAWVDNITGQNLILTGTYRDSVHVVPADEGGYAVRTDVPYAGILEFGNSRQAGHFVASAAADENHEDVVNAAAERLREVIR
jgi:hypothetical protein